MSSLEHLVGSEGRLMLEKTQNNNNKNSPQSEQQNKEVLGYNPMYKTNIHESILIQVNDLNRLLNGE